MTGSILQDKQHALPFRKIQQPGKFHVKTEKIKSPSGKPFPL
jgi:hypothetical protein